MEKANDDTKTIRVLCSRLILNKNEPGLQWLIGSPFFPSLTIVSTLRCIHSTPPSSSSPDYEKESDDLRTLLLKGFEVIGALVIGSSDFEKNAGEAIEAAHKLKQKLSSGEKSDHKETIGAVVDNGNVRFFVSGSENDFKPQPVIHVVYEDSPEKYVWDKGCLLHCEVPIKLPCYFRANDKTDAEKMISRAAEAVCSKFKEPNAAYIFGTSDKASNYAPQPCIISGAELDFDSDISSLKLPVDAVQESDQNVLSCSHFFLKNKSTSTTFSVENADKIQVNLLFNMSERSSKSAAPAAEYIPALEDVKLLVVDFKLEVLCYASKDLPITYAVSKLVIPALADQLNSMKKTILPNLLTQHPQLHAYHFSPPGVLHPVTIIYELNYGETELKQVNVRKQLHLRLGLPFDRPLLRISNALDLNTKEESRSNPLRKGSPLLKDVHSGILSSGVSGGNPSLIQGSYEYYHYLQQGFDDSGWGCAYRSLQTIISWFRLQYYTSVEVPSHREIQQSLVDIGDKDPSFIGSREWIGAIELSFVLDKLLGVSCKIMNVRSGSELPEKCRELAMHFENQGTPVMIGGGVLAYTLLGVDYNETSGDCAFLILDPHYTGTDDLKKIVNSGWIGWKKAVDNKGKSFFLADKFYNLLLPQRPSMV